MTEHDAQPEPGAPPANQPVEALIQDYVDQLDQAFDDAVTEIDPGTREVVIDEVREHVRARLAELDHEPTSQDVQQILAAVGSPADIVASAEEPDVEPSHSVFGKIWVPWTYAGLATVAFIGLLLTPFGFIPVTSYVPLAMLAVAVVLCAVSPLWPPMEKIAAVLLAFIGPPAAIMLAIAHENSVLVCATGRSTIGIPGVLPCLSGMVLGEVLVGLLLSVVFLGCVIFVTVRGVRRARLGR